ncbi:MAG: FAD-linked oxidase C-terminal domain-containing protein [Gemmatimonadota bacterium]
MIQNHVAPGDPALARRLERAVEGEVRFDAFTRGLYSTDASYYQIEPLGVVFPRSARDVEAVLEIAREEGVPVLPRGGGTSQCGQTVGRAVVLDTSRHLTDVGAVEGAGGELTVDVEPGVVLDRLNATLRAGKLWFPVDPSTSSRATLGGMAGNNSAGSRSLRYGMMVENVAAAEIVLADGRRLWVGEGGAEASVMPRELAALRALHAREADEIARRTPRTMRNVAGYDLARLHPEHEQIAQLLVGSEGTLAFFTRLRLKLRPLPAKRALAVCHFAGLLEALDTVQHLVRLRPSAVELVDRTVLSLAAERPDFRSAIGRFVRGTPGALLLVEFSAEPGEPDPAPLLGELETLLADLGYAGSVLRVEAPAAQAEVWSVRQAGLSIVMSMAGPRKPVSFIEDCAVPLEHLAEYARSVDEIFARHDVEGTWYAHASVGCLHVRPALNLKDPEDVARVRSIADATHRVVRELGGTHSGEHGDGILRSEFLRPMLGDRMADAFAEVKRTFDPNGLLNPGKIVDAPRMDDRSLFRYRPGYAGRELPVVLDWSDTGGLLGAVERCDNNGACRKWSADVMCPSFRATADERHSTRGRANALRLALTGQLGADGLDGPEMREALSLCVSCKACKRECPTSVDMSRIKLEWQNRQNGLRGVPLRERVLAALPRVAPSLWRLGPLLDLGASTPLGRLIGLAPERKLPRWARRPWRDEELPVATPAAEAPLDAVLLVDTFTRWFDPQVARAAARVLAAGEWRVGAARPNAGAPAPARPLCCGRTYLSAGMLDEAREEARRTVEALAPYARAGVAILGLEPSCLYTLRDEAPALLPGADAVVVAEHAVLLEEFLDRQWDAGRELRLAATSGDDDDVSHGAATGRARGPAGPPRRVLVHGHCHQKAFGGTASTLRMLGRIPGHDVTLIDSSCCGMAGAFGYHAEHYDVSMRMGELALFPAVRGAPDDATIVADGTSCRAQIVDGTRRQALHAAVVLAEALGGI